MYSSRITDVASPPVMTALHMRLKLHQSQRREYDGRRSRRDISVTMLVISRSVALIARGVKTHGGD